MWLLCRFRIRQDWSEVHILTVELRLVLGPDLLHGQNPLSKNLPALLERCPVVLHFLGVPPAANTENEPPPRQHIEARDRLREGNRVMLDREADSRAQPNARRHGGGSGKPDKRVLDLPVFRRELGPSGPRALALLRDMSVFWRPDRFEAALLRGVRKFVDPNGVLRVERKDPDLHKSSFAEVDDSIRLRSSPPAPASTSSPSRGTSSSRWSDAPAPGRACPCAGRACRGRGGSGRRGGACRGARFRIPITSHSPVESVMRSPI